MKTLAGGVRELPREAAQRQAAQVDAAGAAAGARVDRDGPTFTVETLLQYLWHDVAHHLVDVDA